MGELTIAQHFVPQVHLKKNVSHHDKKLYVYNKNYRKLNKKYYPVEICKRDYIYEMDIVNPNNQIEDTFGFIENKFAKLFDTKLSHISQSDRFIEIDNEEKRIITDYILRLSYGNSEEKIEGSEDYFNVQEETILKNSKSEEEKNIRLERLQIERERWKQEEIPRQIIAMFTRFRPVFSDMNIYFIFNKEGYYITSDNPVHEYYLNNYNPSGFAGPNLFQINYGVAISLSLLVCIEWNAKEKEGSIFLDSKNQNAIDYNLDLFLQANQFIYSPREFSDNELNLYQE